MDGRSSSFLALKGRLTQSRLTQSDIEEAYENEDAGLNVISSGIFSHDGSSVKLNKVSKYRHCATSICVYLVLCMVQFSNHLSPILGTARLIEKCYPPGYP